MIIFFDVGYLALLAILAFLFLGGLANAIVDFLTNHLVVILSICLVIMAIAAILSYFSRRKIRTSLTSLLYSSQFCFFVVKGLYNLGVLSERHPIKCILLFVCFAFYSMFNVLGLLLPLYAEDSADNSMDAMQAILGGVGWIINLIILL